MTPRKIAIPSAGESAEALLYRSGSRDRAVLWAGGWREGDSATGLPVDVAHALIRRGVSSLLLRYRAPYELPSCVDDALASVDWLEGEGIVRVAVVGHSFSGAVVISAAPRSERVVAVAALASQTYGAAGAARVSPRPLLLVHGTEDERLAPYCSEQIYSWARRPKGTAVHAGGVAQPARGSRGVAAAVGRLAHRQAGGHQRSLPSRWGKVRACPVPDTGMGVTPRPFPLDRQS